MATVIAAFIACLVGAGVSSLGARAETVDLLLVLAADVSRSIDDVEFNLQRKGYAAAVTDPQVRDTDAAHSQGRTLVLYTSGMAANLA